ncbi:MAG: hypothetical protein IJC15_07400 [Clostridia bacterium]|nr:hypothetical protein [Clostridia bacterium]
MKQSREDRAREKEANRYAAHADEQTGDYAVRTSRAQDIIARILCALAAVVLWLYVMSIDSPDHERIFTGVLVNIENETRLATNYNMSVISGYENTVSVTVKGKKSDIDKYASSDIIAFVDLSSVSGAGRHVLEVATAPPTGLTVLDVSPNTISVYTDQVASKTVPVDVNLHYTMESTYGLGIPETNIEQVQVSGPVGVLDTIAYARAELDLGQVTTSMTQRVPLKLVGESGEEITNPYLRCNTTDVLVEVPVYMYKEVPVTVAFKYGYLNSSNADIKITPEKLTVRGDPKVLADFDHYEALVLDETKITGDYSQRAKLTLPDGISNVDRIENVTVEVSHIGTSTRELSMLSSRINVKVPQGKGYEFLESVFSFTIRGPEDLVGNFRSNHMTASIDLSSYSDVVGIVTVPLTIAPLSASYADRVYAIGTYHIQVRLS